MKEIVAYKIFNSSEDFENWQIQNDEVKMLNIVPFVGTLNSDNIETQITMETSISILVTYWKSVEQE
jgi:hypothetical protein